MEIFGMVPEEKKEFDPEWFRSFSPIENIFEFEELDSTNRWARIFIEEQKKVAAHSQNIPFSLPFLVTARSQTAGRGRGNHHWWSPEGGLFLTIAAYWSDFDLTRDEPVEISLQTARAVAQTLSENLDTNIRENVRIWVKPPNDVYLNGKKIAGILIESPSADYLLIGIGVNLNNFPEEAPAEIRASVTSLAAETGKYFSPSSFVLRLLQNLFHKRN